MPACTRLALCSRASYTSNQWHLSLLEALAVAIFQIPSASLPVMVSMYGSQQIWDQIARMDVN